MKSADSPANRTSNGMKIIAHRGARNIKTENTISSLKWAANLGVDAIETDVRVTKDKKLVVCHDKNLKRIYGLDKDISSLTFEEIRRLESDGHGSVPTLKEVMELELGKPLILDIKDPGSAGLIHQALSRYNIKNLWSVTSLFPDDLAYLKRLYPALDMTLQTYKHPFQDIKIAKKIKASNINFVLYLLNPLTYHLARRAGLKVRTYQNYLSFLLNSPFIVRILGWIYPQISIYTDRPDKIVPVINRHSKI